MGESPKEAAERNRRYRDARLDWDRLAYAKCSVCGRVRVNVIHETDPASAPEGPLYYEGMADLHEFVP